MMNISFTENEIEYIGCEFKACSSIDEILTAVQDRKGIVKSVLSCAVDVNSDNLIEVYGNERIILNNIEEKILNYLKRKTERENKIRTEIMKNALDMYIRDTSEKIIFIHDNMGNDNGLMKHFKEMLNIAKGMKMKL